MEPFSCFGERKIYFLERGIEKDKQKLSPTFSFTKKSFILKHKLLLKNMFDYVN